MLVEKLLQDLVSLSVVLPLQLSCLLPLSNDKLIVALQVLRLLEEGHLLLEQVELGLEFGKLPVEFSLSSRFEDLEQSIEGLRHISILDTSLSELGYVQLDVGLSRGAEVLALHIDVGLFELSDLLVVLCFGCGEFSQVFDVHFHLFSTSHSFNSCVELGCRSGIVLPERKLTLFHGISVVLFGISLVLTSFLHHFRVLSDDCIPILLVFGLSFLGVIYMLLLGLSLLLGILLVLLNLFVDFFLFLPLLFFVLSSGGLELFLRCLICFILGFSFLNLLFEIVELSLSLLLFLFALSSLFGLLWFLLLGLFGINFFLLLSLCISLSLLSRFFSSLSGFSLGLSLLLGLISCFLGICFSLGLRRICLSLSLCICFSLSLSCKSISLSLFSPGSLKSLPLCFSGGSFSPFPLKSGPPLSISLLSIGRGT